MTDGDALLRAILEDPVDDTVRLAYADWLEENANETTCPKCDGLGCHINPPFNAFRPDRCRVCRGERILPDGRAARAEFIRVQCGLANWNPYVAPPEILEIANSGRVYAQSAIDLITEKAKAHDDRVAELRRRERELWASHTHDWFLGRGLFGSVGLTGTTPVGPPYPLGLARCGFIDHITLPAADFLTHADALFRAHPIAGVVLTNAIPGESVTVSRDARSYWEETNGPPGDHWLVPTALFDHLEGFVRSGHRTTAYPSRQKFYTRTGGATDALSRACVALGRKLAGLTPLPTAANQE